VQIYHTEIDVSQTIWRRFHSPFRRADPAAVRRV